jgi:hypothetical protein
MARWNAAKDAAGEEQAEALRLRQEVSVCQVIYYIMLYYIIFCIVLYCIVLYCIILYYIVLYCAILQRVRVRALLWIFAQDLVRLR